MSSWSWSTWKSYITCPKKIGYKLKGIKEPWSRQMGRGTRLHKDAERYLLGDYHSVPVTLSNFQAPLEELRVAGAIPEEEFAVDEAFNRVDWKSSSAWLRWKTDATYEEADGTKVVIDFKTGNMYPDDHRQQLGLYALGEFKLFGTERVRCEAWYFDQDHIETYVNFHRDQAEGLEEMWRERANKLLSAKEYPATPGRHCRWCGYSQATGGPCKDAEQG